jgi:hypothetical protein
MAQTGSAAPSVVAAGVSEALVTTAGGLIIAVPAVLLYNYFTRRLNVMLTVAENSVRSLRKLHEEIDAAGGPTRVVRGREPAPTSVPEHAPASIVEVATTPGTRGGV